MSRNLKLSDQETKVINYLNGKSTAHWEELAQFAKDPHTVKLKTIKKTVSEIKRKYAEYGVPTPFNTVFSTLVSENKEVENDDTLINAMNMLVNTDGTVNASALADAQVLVPIKRTITTVLSAPAPAPVSVPSVAQQHPAHADFFLDRAMKRVRTKLGNHNLNDNEWEMFKYFHSNVGKLIPISELRDKVVYPQWGSKTPARWFDSIMRIINNLRRQVPGLDRRLLTVKGIETSYLFQ